MIQILERSNVQTSVTTYNQLNYKFKLNGKKVVKMDEWHPRTKRHTRPYVI